MRREPESGTRVVRIRLHFKEEDASFSSLTVKPIWPVAELRATTVPEIDSPLVS
jgi:hypothetical protein